MKRFLYLASFVLAAVFLFACPEQPSSTPCSSASDCDSGQFCKAQVCANCDSASQCSADYGEGAQCVSGKCLSAQCVDGQLDCACINGDSCDQGECVSGTCVDCQRGSEACVCLNNGSCEQGLRCNAQTLCETCPEGEQNCACATGDSCDDPLICDNGVCITDPCPSGSDGCACRADDSCDGELYCDDNSLCATCSNDIEACPCDANHSCENDLVCDADDDTCRLPVACVDLSCVAHQQCQERQPGVDASCLESCDLGFRWNSSACDEMNCLASDPLSIADECSTAHRTCVPQSAGAVCGDCLNGFTDEAGSLADCRSYLTCSDIDCASLFQDCVEGDSETDALCGDCIEGYLSSDAGCFEKNCTAGANGSLVEVCAGQNRLCVDPDDAPASCGACLPDFQENEQSLCQAEHSCGVEDLDCLGKNRLCVGDAPLQYCGDCIDGTVPDPDNPESCLAPLRCSDLDCGDNFCLEGGPGESAHCLSTQCPVGQAYNESSAACVSCVVNCNDSDLGETGRIWPVTQTGSNMCICETEPNFYWDKGERSAKPCDADGDGWVRDAARSAIESSDVTLRENARCQLHSIDRFILENELGQRKTVLLCQGAQPLSDKAEDCQSPAPVPLYETWRNDDQNEIDNDSNAPAYQQAGVGRRFRAAELNGLTRACVNEGGDYNNNGRADMSEWQGMDPAGLSAEAAIFSHFSYFMELHRGWYEQRPDSMILGQYVIQERSRCDSNFPLGYAAGSDEYWRSCTRSRDVDYDATDGQNGPEFGRDFARWSCDSEYGSCPIPPPATEVLADAEIPAHGLCREHPLPAEESECNMSGGPWPCINHQVWRGMSHHSQFRCVKLRDNAGPDLPTLAASEFANQHYDLNVCHIDCPAGDESCATDCSSGQCASSSEAPLAGQPAQPILRCDIKANPATNDIGFAAVKYQGAGGAYQRGCINEWSPTMGGDPVSNPEIASWRSMCPGWSADPVGTIGDGIIGQFGQLACGCGLHYGGLNCDVGCPDSQLNTSPGYAYTPRAGYWMCADFTDSGYAAMDPVYGPALVGTGDSGSTYVLHDDIGLPADGQALCEFGSSGDCSSGYVIY